MSIETIGFADLIAPLTPADISALWRDRKFKVQHRSGENRFPALIDWATLWRLIEEHFIPPDRCRITYGRRLVPPLFYMDKDKINSARLARLFEQGSSVIVANLEEHVPRLSAACHAAVAYGIPVVYAGAIVTAGASGALQTHYDPQDLLILQVEGSKRWRIYGPRVLKPVKEMSTSVAPQTPPLLDTNLEPGDILFLPAGFWHTCDNGAGRSLHLGLFIKRPPASGAQL